MLYLDLFLTFFKIGLFTFGGGYAMIPLIQSEVISHGWLTAEEIIDFIGVSESTPGPFAINMSTYIGRVTGGIAGSVCATLGVVLPSFIIILIVSALFEKFRKSSVVEGVMTGLRPAVIGLIGAALISIGTEVFWPDSGFTWIKLAVSAVIFLSMAFLSFRKLHPIFIILISAAAGIAAGYAFGF